MWKKYKITKKLTKTLTKQIIDGKVHIYGFTDKISDIMDNSKLIITKPGGLTSTEAINKHLPMIIPFLHSWSRRRKYCIFS
ncbi:glycosyltransferase [Sneathia sanguinegens]|uniref:Glycosyltransferase n=1 Tax=Sneathia sanguinegens TaxID=40543 RepID=A0ABT7HKI8_9FUSO|nr:glycosyltransferase [Sneathia sanguinegens]MDK9580140.1 glycosyltransferase [Sneathia sanguinegens]